MKHKFVRNARSIESQTGERRHGPYALYDANARDNIHEFSFRLTPAFIEYYESRYGGSWHWKSRALRNALTGRMSDTEILTCPEFAKSIKEIKYTKAQRKQWLDIIRIQRQKLQDAWELYNLTKGRKHD
jgi:hypothetical protein